MDDRDTEIDCGTLFAFVLFIVFVVVVIIALASRAPI
jgi:hypothetical protein